MLKLVNILQLFWLIISDIEIIEFVAKNWENKEKKSSSINHGLLIKSSQHIVGLFELDFITKLRFECKN